MTGVTTATRRASGKCPDENDEFTMLVNIHDFNSQVSIGSNEQVLLEWLPTNFEISSDDTSLKLQNWDWTEKFKYLNSVGWGKILLPIRLRGKLSWGSTLVDISLYCGITCQINWETGDLTYRLTHLKYTWYLGSFIGYWGRGILEFMNTLTRDDICE